MRQEEDALKQEKWTLVYECSSERMRDNWKKIFDAAIALVERIENGEEE